MNNTIWNKEEEKNQVAAVLTGDRQAFARIIGQTERLVAQIVCKMIANPEDRKDLAQDIYIKAWTKLPAFRFECKLSTWIAQISYTTCIDHLRKKKIPLLDTFARDAEDEEREPAAGKTPDEVARISDQETSRILNAYIERLPPVFRTLVTLFHRAEMSYEEIGEITGMPEGTVKSYLFRARKTLKNNLLVDYKKEDL